MENGYDHWPTKSIVANMPIKKWDASCMMIRHADLDHIWDLKTYLTFSIVNPPSQSRVRNERT